MAYAAAIVYNNIELEFITKTPSKTLNGRRYSGVGGIAAGTNRTSMFVTKAETNEDNLATEQLALFYDFPNINDTSTYYYYYIPQAGHANGMAIDNYNIYICGWRNVPKTGNQTGIGGRARSSTCDMLHIAFPKNEEEVYEKTIEAKNLWHSSITRPRGGASARRTAERKRGRPARRAR